MRPIQSLLVLLLFPFGVWAQQPLEVLVNSRGTNSVKLYDQDGNYYYDFIAPSSGGLINPEDVLFHPDGTILVTGFGNSAIKQYDGTTGDYLGNFSHGYNLSSPSKMSIGPDSLIYVTQWGTTQNKVVRFDLDGNYVDEFTKIGAPNGLGHTWDSHGNFYISLYGNGGNGTVHKFDSLGNSLGTFINSAILQGPTDIWFNKNGDMLVEDWTTGKILRYDSTGQYLNSFTVGMTNPEGVAFFPNGDILVGDWGEDAVHRIDSNGNKLGYFCSGSNLTDPNNVAIREALIIGIKEVPIATFNVTPTVGTLFNISLPPVDVETQLIVLNNLSQVVAILNPSENSVWDASGFPNGIYFIVVNQESQHFTKEVVVSQM